MRRSVNEMTVGEIVDGVKKAVIIIGGTVLTGAALYCVYKVNCMDAALGIGLKKAAENTEINVSDAIVKAATEKAVGAAVREAASAVVDNARADLRLEIKNEVGATVQNLYSSIKDSVAKEVSEKVGRMDLSDLRRQIKDEAKELIMSRLESDMDDTLSDYNRQLESVSKIYSSIADSMKKAVV